MDIHSLYAIYLQHPVISSDTRKITPGCIFFALKGSNFDGNTFASRAIDLGAAYAVVSDPTLQGPQFIFSEDTLQTLQSLANHHRRQFTVPVLAITGSNGKTTTKELVTAVLSQKFKVHATKGNLNNHIGVPLTLLGITADIEFVVCEMGANHAGEIAALCEIAEPTHGLITNIGKAHLEGFGSIEGVKKAKGELFAFLSQHDGFGFVNMDDPNLVELSAILPKRKTYGLNPEREPQVQFTYATNLGGSGFTLKSNTTPPVTLISKMFGHYNATNVLAAYTVGSHFQVDVHQIEEAILQYTPGSNRSETISFEGCIIVKDAYNANPSSMELALKAFAAQYPSGWVILGDMKELGADSAAAHKHIVDLVSSLDVERIFLVGHSFFDAVAAKETGDPRISLINDIQALKAGWDWVRCKGKAILLKGSRSMQLELLLDPDRP